MGFEDFLYNRTQKVVVSGEESLCLGNIWSTPRDSPWTTPFSYLHQHYAKFSLTSISLFADGSYLYSRIRNTLDQTQLLKDLDNLMKQKKEWSVDLNPSRCKVLTVTNKIKPVQHCCKMHGIYLENAVQEKYLGVILLKKLSWKPNVSNVAAKANSTRYL